MGVAIVIPEMPPLAHQVAAYAEAVQRFGLHPVSVPAQGRRADLHKPRRQRKTTVPQRDDHAQAGEFVRERITRLLKRHRALHLQELVGLMPSTKISTIKALLTLLTQSGVVVRFAPGRYRLPPRS